MRTQRRAFSRRVGTMIRPCDSLDFDAILSVINDGARAYRGIVPADCLTDPYMSREELQSELNAGVSFIAVELQRRLAGVMGLQRVDDVLLIRHAYVRSGSQRLGVGAQLLAHLRAGASSPILVGTWADASWAIRFYEKHGFSLVSAEKKVRLLMRYWTVPDRQIETSVVLADPRWFALHSS